MSDQWNGPMGAGRAKPEQLFGQLPRHITAEWDGEDWINLVCSLCPQDAFASINVAQDGAKAQYDRYAKQHLHSAPPKSEQVLKELNDSVPPDPEMTPEAHYAAAEVRLALAETADAAIRERAELDKLPSHTIQTMYDRHCGLANLHRLMAETGLAFAIDEVKPVLESELCGRCAAAGLRRTATTVNARNWPRCADCAVLDQGEEAARVNPPAAPPPLMQPRPLVHIVMDDGEVDGVYDTDSEAIQRRDDLNLRSGTTDASVVSKYVSSPRGSTPRNPFASMTAQPAPNHPSVLVDLFKGFKPGETVTVSPAVAHQIIGQAFVGLNGHGLTMVRNEGEYNGKCVCGTWNNDGYARVQDVALNWATHLDNYSYPDADNETVTVKAKLCKYRFSNGVHCALDADHDGGHAPDRPEDRK